MMKRETLAIADIYVPVKRHSPIPTPLDFVVWKASKTRSIFSGSIPGPESRTATRTPVWSCSVLINNSRGLS
jgi:hypothetical protein